MTMLLSASLVACSRAPTRSDGPTGTVRVTISGALITEEVAADSATQTTGLKNRQSLGADSGMLFVFAYDVLGQRSPLPAEELFEHLKPRISKIEMPAVIEFRDELPKTMIGKLSKKELKAEEEKRTRQPKIKGQR